MDRLLLIALGGAAGTLARYGLTVWAQQRLGEGFPYGTLAVNLVGSFLLAVIMQISLSSDLISPTMRLALGTGVMGGFTTYSTFSYDSFRLVQDDAWPAAITNVLGTVVGCLLATMLGVLAAKRFVTG